MRERYLRSSALICTAALLLLPIAARSARPALDDAIAARPVSAPVVPGALPVHAPLPVPRDPFAAPAAVSSATATGAVVEAVALGAQDTALIEIGRRSALVHPGDRIAGARVARIVSRGVLLDDGTWLPFPQQRP